MMNGSDLASTTASSPKSKEDQVVNGHDEKENNPFAEYMWMENEEDFNRQVRPSRAVAGSAFLWLKLRRRKVSFDGHPASHSRRGPCAEMVAEGRSHPVCVGSACKDTGWMKSAGGGAGKTTSRCL